MRHPLCRLALLLAFSVAAPLHAQHAIPLGPMDSSHVSVDTAQATANVSAPSVSKPVAAGASLVGLRAGVHASETSRPAQPNFQAAHANLGQARAMMIVGVAGLIAGAIIGGTPGTIIMVGGAVVGLLGLYDYVQ